MILAAASSHNPLLSTWALGIAVAVLFVCVVTGLRRR